MFAMIKDELRDYKFLFTDGSKTDNSTTYSVTTKNSIIKVSNIPTQSSIFAAELIAIHEAILHVKGKRGKFVICSDSLSALKSIQNISNNDYYVSQIRNTLIEKFPDLKLVWVPGHNGIKGNEYADLSVKNAAKHPLCFTQNIYCKDLDLRIETKYSEEDRKNIFNLTSSWYRRINREHKTIYDFMHNCQTNAKRLDCIKFERLRLGHTRATHELLFNPNGTPFCNCDISFPIQPSHFLCDCPKTRNSRISIFQNSDPLYPLSYPSFENIELLTKFLKKSNFYNVI